MQEYQSHDENKLGLNVKGWRKRAEPSNTMGAKLFNLLPRSLKQYNNIKCFPKKLKTDPLQRPNTNLTKFTQGDLHCHTNRPSLS